MLGISCGYERDGEEYDDENENENEDKLGVKAEAETGFKTGEKPSLPTPSSSPAPGPDLGPHSDVPSVNGNNHSLAKPSIGSRIVGSFPLTGDGAFWFLLTFGSSGTRTGRVERLAGKVLRDPEIEARGKRHMVRIFLRLRLFHSYETLNVSTVGPRSLIRTSTFVNDAFGNNVLVTCIQMNVKENKNSV